MSSAAWAAALATVGTVLAAFIGWLTVRRKGSGRVDTTPAEVLWQAAETILHDLVSEVTDLRRQRDDLEAERDALQRTLRKETPTQ